MLTVEELCSGAGITKRTFYRLQKENSDFKVLSAGQRVRYSTGYMYNEAVLTWLLKYRGIEQPEAEGVTDPEQQTETAEQPQPEQQQADQISALEAQLREAQQDKAQLTATNTQLLETVQKLTDQNEKTLLLLAQAQHDRQELQEQLFLLTAPAAAEPTPKRKWWERLFKGKND